MAKQMPKIYFGLHFVSGPAEYTGPNDRIYIGEECAKQMDSTFAGCPVYVQHKEVNLEKIQEEADGYVVESFFNKHDGKHWCKFVVVSDAAHEAILNGWKLSNAYSIKKSGESGKCHNIDYAYEVLDAEYNHLAIVQNPRYEESVVLTPEQFKEYNLKKETELRILTNSKTTEKKFMFNFFEKKPIENSKEFGEMSVKLENGKELTVNELVSMMNKRNSEDKDADDKKKEEEKKNEDEKCAKEKLDKENADKEIEEKKNADEKAAKEIEEKKNEIKNAIDAVVKPETIDLSANKIARGQRLYGSNK